jgi:aldose 1-epimerase
MNNNSYNLAINNGPNHLHGGLRGFDKNIWNFTLVEEPERVGVKFTYISVDGEESYPGNLKVSAEYYLTSTNEIHMIFDAKTDKNTPINMTNHAFWNLSGNFCRSIKEHSLQLACSHYLPVNSTLIPTGEIAHVNGTPFDFTNPKQLGDAIENINHVGSNGIGNFTGIDHCFVNDNTDTTENRYVATLTDDISGRQLIVYSNQTSVQIYTGNFLSKDPNDAPFVVHNAMCIENQNFPNSPNQPNFPSIILNPGEKYHHSAVYCLRNVEMNS